MHPAATTVGDDALAARPRRIEPFDFRRTSRFSSEQQARLRGLAHEAARAGATALTGDLRTLVSIDVIAVDQTTWGAALAALSPGSLCTSLQTLADRPPLLLCTELPFLLRAIDRAVGSDGSAEPRQRTLTELDLRLAMRLFGVLARGLDAEWHEVTGGQLELGTPAPVAAAGTLAAPGEPTLAVALEVRMDGSSSALTLLLPYATVTAFPGLSEPPLPAPPDPGPTRDALERTLARATVTVRAEVAALEMPVSEVLALRPGDVISFTRLADEGVTLHVGEKRTHRALPGRQGRRRAVQVTERLEEAR